MIVWLLVLILLIHLMEMWKPLCILVLTVYCLCALSTVTDF